MKQVESSLDYLSNKPSEQRITALGPARHLPASLSVHSKTTGRWCNHPYSKMFLRSDFKKSLALYLPVCISQCVATNLLNTKSTNCNLFKSSPQSSAAVLSSVEENCLGIKLISLIHLFRWKRSETRTIPKSDSFCGEFERIFQLSMKYKHSCIIAELRFYSD